MNNPVWSMTPENSNLFSSKFSYETIHEGDYCEPHINYQGAEYIDNGFSIEVYSDRFELHEEELVFTATTINDILDYYKKLS